MKTLRFLSAEAFVSNSYYARRNLCFIAHNLYPLLLKASYLLEQGEVLHDIVQHWPLTELDLGKLLERTADCEEDISNRTCSICLRAFINGLKEYVLCRSSKYTKKLRVVDLTGIKDVQFQACRCKKSMGRWARSELLSSVCSDLLIEMQEKECDPAVFSTVVNVRIDLFVTERSYESHVQALLLRCHCPLKIRCVGFRADSLALRKLFYIIKLTEPESLQKLEMVHNIRLEMEHLEVLLDKVSFPQLRTLVFPAKAFDVRRLSTENEELLSSLGDKLSNLSNLRQLGLAFSVLTGRIRRLLSPLKTPLQVLDVANCCLTHVDMAYLANSLHSEHLVELDLSGHSVTELFPSTFFKLLNRASHTLKRLTLEECNIGDGQINMMILGLVSCRRLQEFRFIGNPISSRGLKRLFNMFIGLPQLQYVEFPVPRECYPDDVTYPLDETTLSSYDRNKYEDIRAELQLILVHANREDISVSTPLFGSFDPNIHETSYELGVGMLQSFKDALASFVTSLKNVN